MISLLNFGLLLMINPQLKNTYTDANVNNDHCGRCIEGKRVTRFLDE